SGWRWNLQLGSVFADPVCTTQKTVNSSGCGGRSASVFAVPRDRRSANPSRVGRVSMSRSLGFRLRKTGSPIRSTNMRGNVSRLRNSRKIKRRRPMRNPFRARLALEPLERRLAPANVPVLSGHYDAFLSGANVQETVLTPANVNASNFGRLFNY